MSLICIETGHFWSCLSVCENTEDARSGKNIITKLRRSPTLVYYLFELSATSSVVFNRKRLTWSGWIVMVVIRGDGRDVNSYGVTININLKNRCRKCRRAYGQWFFVNVFLAEENIVVVTALNCCRLHRL